MMQAFLFGVSPTEPAVFGSIAALLLFVAVLARQVPVRRAMRLDPLEALRQKRADQSASFSLSRYRLKAALTLAASGALPFASISGVMN